VKFSGRYTGAKLSPGNVEDVDADLAQPCGGLVMIIPARIIQTVRWVARGSGTLLLALVAAIALGEGFPNPLRLSAAESQMMVAMLTIIAGLAAAWRWEGIGGGLVLGGLSVFSLVNHGMPVNLFFLPVLATGLMYVLCWWSHHAWLTPGTAAA
jgi:hypothetical protein